MTPLAKYKLVFLGDQGVGKTSILTCFKFGRFNNNYEATIGVEFVSKRIKHGDRNCRLLMWDTAGQERFKSMISGYIRHSSVAVIVYDVANKQSFLNTSNWIEDVRAERGSDVIIVLVGNKTDLVHSRQVSVEEGDNKAREVGALFIETSASAEFNIEPLFCKITSALQGMEAVTWTKKEDLVDVNVKPLTNSSQALQKQGNCSC